MLSDTTLIVVADGGVARFLSRARPGARLAELVDVRMGAEAMEPARDRPPRVHDSVGSGRHAIERRPNPHDAAEDAFLQSVAEKTHELIRLNKISQLVLCAPPRALGVLRAALSPPGARAPHTLMGQGHNQGNTRGNRQAPSAVQSLRRYAWTGAST